MLGAKIQHREPGERRCEESPRLALSPVGDFWGERRSGAGVFLHTVAWGLKEGCWAVYSTNKAPSNALFHLFLSGVRPAKSCTFRRGELFPHHRLRATQPPFGTPPRLKAGRTQSAARTMLCPPDSQMVAGELPPGNGTPKPRKRARDTAPGDNRCAWAQRLNLRENRESAIFFSFFPRIIGGMLYSPSIETGFDPF